MFITKIRTVAVFTEWVGDVVREDCVSSMQRVFLPWVVFIWMFCSLCDSCLICKYMFDVKKEKIAELNQRNLKRIKCITESNNLRYADDTMLMTGSEEQLKSLQMRVKEES